MRCDRCQLELPPGAEHPNDMACILALRMALEKATACRLCQAEVPVTLCNPCAAQAWAKWKASQGANAAVSKFVEWLSSGPQGGGEGKRFEP
jgi:hypothetical protein